MTDLLEKLKAHAVRIALGFAVLVVFLLHVSGVTPLEFIERMENLAYDARLQLTMQGGKDPRIVIVDIDEKSLEKEGRWPWGRDRMSTLVEQLFDRYKVALVGFDIVFAEPDNSSGLNVLQKLAETDLRESSDFRAKLQALSPRLDNDGRFAAVLAKHPVVLGYYFNNPSSTGVVSKSGALPPPTFVRGSFRGKKVEFVVAAGYNANLERFQTAASGGGHFNPTVDSDGIVRRVPMIYEYDGAYYESLSLAMARLVLGVAEVRPVFEPPLWGAGKGYVGLEWLQLGERLVPVDAHVQALIPFRGRQGSFPYISATDVISGKADPATLRGAVVLVGTTAPALFDLRATPVASTYAGVELHANIVAGILDGRVLKRPEYTRGAEFMTVLVTGLALALALPVLSPLAATAVTIGVVVLTVGFNLAIWQFGGLVLPVASGLIMILFIFLLNMSYGFFIEARGKRQMAGLFGHYIPPELVEEMGRNPTSYSLQPFSLEMTVLFSDVRGFTTISEGLKPKELSELMNSFLTPMTRVIHNHRGTIDKYMGDAIMAFWGAPVPDSDHARHAIEAALDMVRNLEPINVDFRARGWPEIKIGVGINTGVMSVGNMGSEFRQAYTVLGDAVNLGSRLEGLTKGYGVSVVVSESTRAAVPDYAYRELDRVRVKGKDQPVSIYEPLCPSADVDRALRDEIKLYKTALAYYRSQNWDMAELQFLALVKNGRAKVLYEMYAERVAYFRREPPAADWDGVFTFKTK